MEHQLGRKELENFAPHETISFWQNRIKFWQKEIVGPPLKMPQERLCAVLRLVPSSIKMLCRALCSDQLQVAGGGAGAGLDTLAPPPPTQTPGHHLAILISGQVQVHLILITQLLIHNTTTSFSLLKGPTCSASKHLCPPHLCSLPVCCAVWRK